MTPTIRHYENGINIDSSTGELTGVAKYDEYRQLLNENSGLDLIGIGDEETYQKILNSHKTIFKIISTPGGDLNLPIAASNDDLEFFDPQYIPVNALMVISPQNFLTYQEIEELKKVNTLLLPEQKMLNEELTDKYLSKMRSVSSEELHKALEEDSEHTLMPKTGFAGFIGVSRYDITDCEDLKQTPLPTEIITNNTISTTSVDYIKEKLPELIKLHEEIFNAQTEKLGYYDGLDAETTIDILGSGDFTPVATFDKDTGEALAFAIFARNLSDLHDLGWLNGESTQKVVDVMRETKNPILAVPFIIVSKGGGNFPLITKIAAHATLENSEATELFTITKTSAMSINYTPAIINNTLQKMGFNHKDSVIEATFLTKI